MLLSHSATARMLRISVLVAAGDAVTKSCAAAWLAGRSADDTLVGLALVHNDQGAFGLSVGAYTWQLNLALTLAAIALVVPVCRALAQVDGRAPDALGLIAGGALGNLLSLILSPFGVLDFIALSTGPGTSIVLNAADIAAYVGLAMLLRTAWLLSSAIAASQSTALATTWQQPTTDLRVTASGRDDAEVARAVFVEPGVERPRAPRPERVVDHPTARESWGPDASAS